MKRITVVSIVLSVVLALLIVLGFFIFAQEREIKQPKEEILPKELKTSSSETTGKARITLITIYDNYKANPELKTGWGFSCLVKIEGENILFDTGADSETLLSNMEKMGIDPKEIDFVFISHWHADHIGGLAGILKIKPNLKVYKPESFSDPAQIINGVWTTGPLGTDIKEQSLIIKSTEGLIIITGCSHPGIVNIVKKAKEMFPHENVYLVLGGFHLFGASDSELKTIINDFQKLGVQKVAPCHCSGDRCRELFKKEYRENFIENGVGKIIEITKN
jgi:7,8-dihydropterin-6-yl-methyl-4-(beta-D-ribofuranosyl)aminobenzene 5'-phosphate synthase